MTPVLRFDPSGPLPRPGLHILEASAGTGKTFTIAELVRRFVAEDVADIGRILAMTFGRSATQELRDRIRRELRRYAMAEADQERVERARRALADFDGAAIMTIHEFCTDAFARFGVRADADPGAELAEDLGDQVAATAHDVYTDLFAADPPVAGPDPDGTVRTKDLTATRARSIARELAAHPDAELIEGPLHPAAPEAQRVAFARTVRRRTEQAKRREGTISYDDLVLRLRDAVRDTESRASLRERFRVVLVDEFQDTDPAQWAIVRDTFVAGGATVVVLIGDPKQGIYSFRGADIHSYTQARDTPGALQRTLGMNFRSDGPVVAGVLDLLRDLEVGDGILVHDVEARHRDTRIHGPAMDAGGRRVRLRVCRATKGTKADALWDAVATDTAREIARTLRQGATIETDADRHPTGERPVSAGDIAVIVRTNSQAALMHESLRRSGIPAVVNSQVSVFTSRAAADWLALLRAMERPRGNRLRVAALTELLHADPGALGTTPERTLTEVATRITTLAGVFRDHGIPAVLATALRGSGGTEGVYARMLSRIDGERYLTDLRHVGSLLHQEHRQARLELTGLADWLADQIAAADSQETERSEALTRRLDTDADAVQVVTIHRCKGLQYAIAYVPFGTSTSSSRSESVVCTTDLGTDPPRMRRVMDVRSHPGATPKAATGKGPGRVSSGKGPAGSTPATKVPAGSAPTGTGPGGGATDEQVTTDPITTPHVTTNQLKAIRSSQSLAEDLRMLYVALTRGIHEVVITWAMAEGAAANRSPLHRALSATEGVPAQSYPSTPPLAKAQGSAHVAVEHVRFADLATEAGPVAAQPAQASPSDLAAAPYLRDDIDTAWTRASFTALTSGAHRRPLDMADETVLAEKDDEPVEAVPEEWGPAPAASGDPTAADPASAPSGPTPADLPSSPLAGVPSPPTDPSPADPPTPPTDPFVAGAPSPPAGLPAGRAFGTLVHAVLELVDTGASDLPAELLRRCRDQLARRPVSEVTPEQLADLLLPVLRTPLGQLAPGATLATVRPADRLAELDFELPLRQGSGSARTVAAIGALLAGATSEPDWVRGYGDSLQRAPFGWRQLRGYLTGSIDAVLRIDGRCCVVDYKTNRLGPTLGDYHPELLPAAMAEAHYPLQALLYSAALHRFLRVRQRGYDPEQHLGGILYLFVRGMVGPDTPVDAVGDPCGVFAWRPEPALVVELSDLLGGDAR